MKKVMFGLAAVAAMAALADIESSNTVGFMRVSPRPTQADSEYAVGGSMFVVPAGQTWKISDLKILGGSGDSNDCIKFLKKDGSSLVDDAKSYYYWVDEDPSLTGWYYAFEASGKWDEMIEPEDDVIPAGTAFLCLFNTPGAKIEYAGEVITGTDGWISIPRGVSAYGLMNNPLPYAIDLTACKIVDGAGDANDVVKFFKTNGSSVVDDARAYYYWIDENPSLTGWYYAFEASGKWDEMVEKDTEVIPAGGGFLYLFNTAAAKFCFPAPTL